MTKAKSTRYEQMPILNLHAAGIDVGSREYYVAIGQGRDQVKTFGVYTEDLISLCTYLQLHGITSVALESTGSYWKNLFMLLQQHGLNPILVNGSFTKNLKGRKTDVLDCQFIQRMHSLGLLPDSFQPDDFTDQVRTLVRHRTNLLAEIADNTKRVQQCLRNMNVRLDVAVSDTMGKSGQSIIQAIIDGERNAKSLASLCDKNVKKSEVEIAAALNGFFRSDYLIQLKQLMKTFHFFRKQLSDLDIELSKIMEQHLIQNNKSNRTLSNIPKDKKRLQKNDPKFNLEEKAYQLFNGVNLMEVPGISYGTALVFISEVGENINKFSSAKAFSSWLRLAPNKKITGGKVIGNGLRHGANALSLSLRSAANTIGNMKKEIPLTRFFKRLAYKYGRTAAITGTARKLAVIIWNMTYKTEAYQPPSNDIYEHRIRYNSIKNIQRKINSLKIKQEDLCFVSH
jgi:transposase